MRIGTFAKAAVALTVLGGVGVHEMGAVRAQPSAESRPKAPARSPSELERIRNPAPAPPGSVALGSRSKPRATPELATSPPPRFTLPLRVAGSQQARKSAFRVTEGADAARITTSEQGEPAVELPNEGRTVVTSEEAPEAAQHSLIEEASKTALPWLVIDTRKTAEGTKVLATRPFLKLARAILWDDERKAYIAELLFGVDPEPGHPSEGALDPPFRARFTVSCDDVTPADAEVSAIGPAGYQVVRVACSPAVKNERPSQVIEVHVGSGTLSYPFQLPHRPGNPLLLASDVSVPGLGLGTVRLTVKQVEEDGSLIEASEPLAVQLLAEGGGTFSPNQLTIAKGEREASVEVHPTGLGKLEVAAALGELRSDSLTIQLRWPWLAMFAMLAGALIGAFLDWVRNTRQRTFRRALADVLAGMLVAAATLLLPALTPLPSWARPTELAFFLIAAAAAFIGLNAFDALSRRLLPGMNPKGASPVVK